MSAIDMDSNEKYQATLALGNFLRAIGIPSAKELIDDVIYIHGPDWELCDDCGNNVGNCECDSDYHRGSIYDDEGSFE